MDKLKDMAALAGLAIIIMAGFAYRYDIQDFGSRMTAGLIPGSPIAGSSSEGRRQVTFIRGNNGQFQAKASVNGQDVDFLIDTGASSVVLTNEDARRIGVDMSKLAYTVDVSTANGWTKSADFLIDRMDIGEIQRKRVTGLVAREGELETSLMGMSYFTSFWGFEIRGDRLTLTD